MVKSKRESERVKRREKGKREKSVREKGKKVGTRGILMFIFWFWLTQKAE